MSDPAQTKGRYRIEALAKGLQVLRLFDGTEKSLKVSEIATRTGIPLPTTFRIIATLEEFGFIERLENGSVCPGLGVLTLGTAALRSSSLLEVSARPLRRLAEITGETVNLGVLTDDRVLYVARLKNNDLVTANVQVGSTLPAVYTSMGKLLLAYLSESELEHRVTAASFAGPAGPNALTDIDALKTQLTAIQEQGYAVQDEELALGLRSISVPVFGDGTNPVAALNVAVATARHELSELIGSFLDPLRTAATEISVRLRNA